MNGAHRRGGIAVIVGFSMVGLVGFLALALDIGLARTHQSQLHAVLDAAALAGATAIGNTAENEAEVEARARAVTAENAVGKRAIELSDAEIEIGTWAGGAFTPGPTGDAVRVTHTLPVATNFARILGWDVVDVDRVSIAKQAVTWIDCGIVGAERVRHWGTGDMDSYPSDAGAYVGPPHNDKAGLCSNGTIDVGGNATVWGNAAAGPDVEANVSGSAQITGYSGRLTTELALPTPDWTTISGNNDNDTMGWAEDSPSNGLRPLRAGSTTITLGPGTFWVDEIRIGGTSVLEIVPPVELWVDGDVLAAGQGLLNLAGDPAGLTVYVRGDVDLRGTSDFYGVIIAEGDFIYRGTSDFYGALFADTLEVRGTGGIHQDESLPPLLRIQAAGVPRLVQ